MDELLDYDILSKEEYITKLKALQESNHRLPTRECKLNCVKLQ